MRRTGVPLGDGGKMDRVGGGWRGRRGRVSSSRNARGRNPCKSMRDYPGGISQGCGPKTWTQVQPHHLLLYDPNHVVSSVVK